MLDNYDLMKLLATSGKYRGFTYLLDCLNLAAENDDLMQPLKGKLYPLVAKKHGTTANCVERNIRTIINIAWKSENTRVLKALFDADPSSDVPSNKEFISRIAARLQRNKNLF